VSNWEKQITAEVPRLRRYARALTQNPSAADDLVQECLERAWGKQTQWQTGTNLRAWLFTIVHNCFINETRARNRADEYLDQVKQSETGSYSDSNIELLNLQQCLQRLSQEHREVIVLAGLEGLSYQEIASVIDAPVGTVMSRLSRAREELRTLMAHPIPDNVVKLK